MARAELCVLIERVVGQGKWPDVVKVADEIEKFYRLTPKENPEDLPQHWCGSSWDHGPHVVHDTTPANDPPYFCPGGGWSS